MNRNQLQIRVSDRVILAATICQGLLASGHYTEPATRDHYGIRQDEPFVIGDLLATEDGEHIGSRYLCVAEAFRLADAMIEQEGPQ